MFLIYYLLKWIGFTHCFLFCITLSIVIEYRVLLLSQRYQNQKRKGNCKTIAIKIVRKAITLEGAIKKISNDLIPNIKQ